MKDKWIILPAILFVVAAKGQTLMRPTFSDIGNNDAGFTFTVGEPVAYYSNSALTGSLSIGAQPGDKKTGVGINDPELLNKISLFPNPTDGILSLQIEDADVTPFSVFLYNTPGQKLAEYTMSSGVNTIDLCNQPAGAFFLLFVRGDKQVQFSVIKH